MELARASGRALAIDRPGRLQVRPPTAVTVAPGRVDARIGSLAFVSCKVTAHNANAYEGHPGSLRATVPTVTVVTGHAGVGHPGSLGMSPSVVTPGISGTAHAHPGSTGIRAQLFTLHIGSSAAGALLTPMMRTSPVRQVVEYDSQGPTNSDIISATRTLWLDAMVSNSGSSTLYWMCFDSATVPTNGSLPLRQPLQVGAGGQTYTDLGNPGADGISGRPVVNGLSWAASTTATTLTIDTTSSLWVTARTLTRGHDYGTYRRSVLRERGTR